MTAPPQDPVFVVGCPRSGTALLRDLLRAHPRLSFPQESHFIPSFHRAFGDPRDEAGAIARAQILLGLSWVRRWDLGLVPADFAACRSYAAIVERMYAAWLAREGKSRWGDKTPQYVREIPALAAIFPSARFVHIVRDGRDVALSLLRAPFGPENLGTAAVYWSALVRAGRRDGAALGAARYREIRYEDLLADPGTVLGSLLEFLGEAPLEGTPRIDRLERDERPAIFGARSAARGAAAGVVSSSDVVVANAGKWRHDLDPRGRVLFESIAGDLLAELGYETGAVRRNVGPAERALHAAHDRVRSTLRRLNSRRIPDWTRNEWLLLRARRLGRG